MTRELMVRCVLHSATGYIGWPTVQALSRAGHIAYGLVRQESQAQKLRASESTCDLDYCHNLLTVRPVYFSYPRHRRRKRPVHLGIHHSLPRRHHRLHRRTRGRTTLKRAVRRYHHRSEGPSLHRTETHIHLQQRRLRTRGQPRRPRLRDVYPRHPSRALRVASGIRTPRREE